MQSPTLDSSSLLSTQTAFNRLDATVLQASPFPLPLNSAPLTSSSQQVLTVTSTADTVDDKDGVLTLREAIYLANRTPGSQTINFDLGAGAKTITLIGGQLSIQDTLVIKGTGNLIIDGNKRSRILDIMSNTSVTLTKLSLNNGAALTGGGAISNGGTVNLVDVTLDGNSSTLGGALANLGNAYLTNVTIDNNRATQGGGIYNAGYLNISNSTLSGNTAILDGGGLYSERGSVEIQSSTFTLNMADWDNDGNGNGGGIRANSGSVTIQNTIVANNFDGVTVDGNLGGNLVRHYDVSGTFTDLGYNLIGDGTGSTGWTVRSRVGTFNQRIDPKLAPLRNNGGFTQTHALLQDSPALNSANSGTATLTDQRGIQRMVADIGAYEALPNLTVDSLTDESDANISAGDVSLREALQYIVDGGTINFAPGLRGTITLELGELLIDRDVSIRGSGAGNLTIRGDSLPSVFSIVQNVTADINDLTVINGYRDGGAGISNAGNLTLSSLTIRDTNGAFSSALKNKSKATLHLYRSSLIKNGGFSVVLNFGTMTIQNSTISNNFTQSAIYNEGGTIAINASTITEVSLIGINNAKNSETQGVVKVKNTIIANNQIDVLGVFISEGHNLIGNGGNAIGFTHGQNGDQVGTARAKIDPKLGELKDNGGSTWTRALLAGSPALNAANPYDRPQTDQRGVDRGSRPDIGAYENAPAIARSDSAAVRRGSSVIIPVLSNDFDVDGDSFTIVSYSNPRSGRLTRNADGTLTYTSRSSLLPIYSFTYTISDGKGETSTATVQLRIV